MLLVREELTKILLEVTNEKILEISSETLSKYRRKGICAIENFLITWNPLRHKIIYYKKKEVLKNSFKWQQCRKKQKESGAPICEKSLDATRHVAEMLFLY